MSGKGEIKRKAEKIARHGSTCQNYTRNKKQD